MSHRTKADEEEYLPPNFRRVRDFVYMLNGAPTDFKIKMMRGLSSSENYKYAENELKEEIWKQTISWNMQAMAIKDCHLFNFDQDASHLMTLTDNENTGARLPFPATFLNIDMELDLDSIGDDFKGERAHLIGVLLYEYGGRHQLRRHGGMDGIGTQDAEVLRADLSIV